jgi:hypothetical protein
MGADFDARGQVAARDRLEMRERFLQRSADRALQRAPCKRGSDQRKGDARDGNRHEPVEARLRPFVGRRGDGGLLLLQRVDAARHILIERRRRILHGAPDARAVARRDGLEDRLVAGCHEVLELAVQFVGLVRFSVVCERQAAIGIPCLARVVQLISRVLHELRDVGNVGIERNAEQPQPRSCQRDTRLTELARG